MGKLPGMDLKRRGFGRAFTLCFAMLASVAGTTSGDAHEVGRTTQSLTAAMADEPQADVLDQRRILPSMPNSQADFLGVATGIADPAFSPAAQLTLARGRVIPESYFGMHVHRGLEIPWPSGAITTWRLWDTRTNWFNVEPEKGRFAFEQLDRLVDLASKNGVEVVLTLGMTPRWASVRPDEPCSYGVGCAAPPRSTQDWADYVRALGERYRGRIRFYEVWNEPTLNDVEPYKRGFFSGSTSELVELARVAHETLKRVDPSVRILSPAFHEEGGVFRLDRFLGAGGRHCVDVIAHHLYRSIPESLPPLVEQVRRIMLKHGVSNLPLWNTESGFLVQNARKEVKPTRPEPWSWNSRVLSQSELSGFIPRALVLAFAAGVERFYWYAWDNRYMGVSAEEGHRESPGITAWTRTRAWLVGTTFDGCDRTGSRWVCRVRKGPTRRGWLMWDTDGSSEWRVPPTWGAVALRNIEGPDAVGIRRSQVTIGPIPVLLTSDLSPW